MSALLVYTQYPHSHILWLLLYPLQCLIRIGAELYHQDLFCQRIIEMLLLERFGFAPCLASGAGRGIPKGRIIFDGSEEWSVAVGL